MSLRVTGAFLNALGILLGGLYGLVRRAPLGPRAQSFFKAALGLATFFFGLRLVWLSIHGTFLAGLKQIVVALLAVTLGNLVGKLLRFQSVSNRLGRQASRLMAAPARPRRGGDGFVACAILFCAAPLGLLGAVADGLSGFFWLLAIKAVMDGLAMTSFVKMFGWPAALSAVPVLVVFGGITLACALYAGPFLQTRDLLESVNAAGGLVVCTITLVIFEVRKVELANFLPALAVAPLLTWLVG